jgi:Leucine-rich repeat (LRR) protein
MSQGRIARATRPFFDCSNQNLTSLPSTANAGQVMTLLVSDNLLRRVPNMRDFSILETLNLANNRLSDLSPLASLESLRVIDISFNAVTSLSFCEDLVNLATSHNSIASVPIHLSFRN